VSDHAAAPPASARLFAWLGAALFFVSLAYFLFSYVTTFGMAAAGGDAALAITWNVTLFTLFAVHHSLFARERLRRWVARVAPAPLERSFYVWIASLLFIGVCAFWRPVPGVAWEARGVLVWGLRLLQAVGIWLTLRSAAILDIWELAGIRRPEPSGPEFKTTGPYGWVRHPIYSGWFLMVFAASPMTMTRLVFAVVSSAYLLVAIPLEERSMRASGAGAYERYMARVRWRVLPGVY
jgi:protein-S-isoprenylcysteine O-methyltransferase Ste14